MDEARSRDRWDHTSVLLCLLANIHRDPKKSRAFQPADFHPLEQRRKKTVDIPDVPMKDVKHLFKDLFNKRG